MRKRVFGKKLKRTTNQRKALFRSLTQALVLHGRIKTTEAKAKSIKGEIEKLITYAKNNKENAYNHLQHHVHPKTAEGIITIAPVFENRPGGYTRIIRIGGRKKDNAAMVLLEFVEKTQSVVMPSKKTEKKPVEEDTKKEDIKIKKGKDAKPNKTNKK
ncbi:MAG: 50S ribosomal protein L17 [Candidatus Levybacteria bacterium]|nr:50S ribosomal protein L17 [Candidatus Levybacteria bacterium]MBP9814886.1 50S ribosomal protein L17 [Candidatus Levybacteria bacterium]